MDTGASVLVLPHLCMKRISRAHTCNHWAVIKENVKCSATFFIVESGTALIGNGDLIFALQLCIERNTITSAQTKNLPASLPQIPLMQLSSPAPHAATVCVKGFMHKVKVLPSAVPVLQKLWLFLSPYMLMCVSDELNRLLATGVIEKVDALLWISPISTQKKTWGIRNPSR